MVRPTTPATTGPIKQQESGTGVNRCVLGATRRDVQAGQGWLHRRTKVAIKLI